MLQPSTAGHRRQRRASRKSPDGCRRVRGSCTPATRPARQIRDSSVQFSRTSAPCSRAASTSSRSCKSRGMHTPKSIPSWAGRKRSSALMPSASTCVHRTRDGLSARIRGRAPSLASSLVPAGISRWVESWSDGKRILSRTTTLRPARAIGAAAAQPAKRAPTITTSARSMSRPHRRWRDLRPPSTRCLSAGGGPRPTHHTAP